MSGADAVPRRRHPPELAPDGFALVSHTAREDIGVVAEGAEDLRKLRGMAERIGDVRDSRGAPELARTAQPFLKVPNDRLARNEEEVRENVPWADEQAIGFDERLDARDVGGTLLEIVLDRDGLSIEGERAEVRVALEDVEEAGDHRHEPRAVALEALVPLAVPVRVRDDERAPAESPAEQRDGAGREEPGDDADRHAANHVVGVVHA